MSIILSVHARQILDSRGNPTVEVDVVTENGVMGRAAVPSGASTGEHEAVELRDGGDTFMGKAVMKAVKNVNTVIAEEILGMLVFDQNLIDQTMIDLDGTRINRNWGQMRYWEFPWRSPKLRPMSWVSHFTNMLVVSVQIHCRYR